MRNPVIGLHESRGRPKSLRNPGRFSEEIPTGLALAEEIEAYRVLYNEVRPHEALGFLTPMEAYLTAPEANLFGAGSVQET